MADRPPFYPRHWRLLALLGVGTALYAAGLYVPPAVRDVRALRAEVQDLNARTVSSPDVSRRWARLRSVQAAASHDSSASATLVRLQDTAGGWGMRLVDLRPGTSERGVPESGERWELRAQGPFAAAAGFLSALEQPGAGFTLERYRLASADTLRPHLVLTARLRLRP